MNENPYIYKGPLNPLVDKQNHVCVSRSEELNTVIEGIMRGEYWAVLGPKQIGKTTFLRMLQNQLPNDYPVYFNLQVSPPDENTFYQGLMDTLLKKIPHSQKPKIPKKAKNSKPELRFLDFLKEFIPENTTGRIVLLFDEIDRLPFLKEFLFLWRRSYHERYQEESLNRYIIIVTGSVNLIELTINEASPFNIAETLYLKDFEKDDSEKLIVEPLNRLDIKIDDEAREKLSAQISGHPQMLQHACHILVNKAYNSNRLITEKDVNNAIEELFITSASLDTLRQDLTMNEELRDLMWDIFSNEQRKFFPYKKYSMLGAGAIIEENSFCKIRNQVYKTFIINVLRNIEEEAEAAAPRAIPSTQPEETTYTIRWRSYITSMSFILSIITGFISTLMKSPKVMIVSVVLALIALGFLISFLFTEEVKKGKKNGKKKEDIS